MPWPNHSTKHATIPPFSSTQIQKRFWRNAAPLETLCVVDRLVSDNRTDSLAWIRPPDWLPLLPIIHRFRHRLHPSPETFPSSRSRLPFSLSLSLLFSLLAAPFFLQNCDVFVPFQIEIFPPSSSVVAIHRAFFFLAFYRFFSFLSRFSLPGEEENVNRFDLGEFCWIYIYI